MANNNEYSSNYCIAKFNKLKETSQNTSSNIYAALEVKMTTEVDSQFVIPLQNHAPVKKLVNPHGETTKLVTFQRGYRFGKKQNLSFIVESSHEKYFLQYQALELLFSKFLECDRTYSEATNDSNAERDLYLNVFTVTNVECLPESMYYIENRLTTNVTRWLKFKKLLEAIDLNIDPIVVSTVKYKFFNYLLEQRTSVTMEHFRGSCQINRTTTLEEIHKVMDLFFYMPYCYLFHVFKAMHLFTNLAFAGSSEISDTDVIRVEN